MNLHDWIDELCDVLDLETEVDEGLLNDLAELARINVEHDAGPVTTYLLGYAAGSTAAGAVALERLATLATELAEAWDRPTGDDVDDLGEIEDDGSIADLAVTDDDDDDSGNTGGTTSSSDDEGDDE